MSASMSYKDFNTLSALTKTMTDDQIGELYGVTGENICYWRKKLSIPATQRSVKGNRLYLLDEGFFDTVDSPEKAYVLGFIVADGCVHKNLKSLSIAIAQEDVEVLVFIKDALRSTAPIREKVSRRGTFTEVHLSVLHVCSKKLVSALARLGVLPNKSLTVPYPRLPIHLDAHFIRGVLDGDGYVGSRQFAFAGSEALMRGIQQAIELHSGQRLHYRLTNQHPALIGSRRNRDALVWIYEGASLKLDRKFQKFVQFWL
jgi:hypothetical protein